MLIPQRVAECFTQTECHATHALHRSGIWNEHDIQADA